MRPKSHVTSETAKDKKSAQYRGGGEKRREDDEPAKALKTSPVVIKTCRFLLNSRSCGQKYVSMTSRQTNASSGRVANMLAPLRTSMLGIRQLLPNEGMRRGQREKGRTSTLEQC